MFKRSVSTCLAGVSVLFLTAHCLAEVPATAFDSWKSYKVGTTVVVEESDSDHPELHRRYTTKLLKLGDGEAQIEEVGDEPDAKPSTRTMRGQKLSDQIHSHPASTTQPANPVEGDEDIYVAGQKIHAHRIKDVRSADTSYTYFVSDKVPGGIAIIQFTQTREGNPTRVRTWKVVEITLP